jgi:LiaI-LiaF-like transmembrane region
MNCANHPETANEAFCRICGKPLCAACSRPVQGVIYCETCLVQRLGTMPQAVAPGVAPGVVPGAPSVGVPPVPPAAQGPNPALAGILAGFFPFGVGAVYTGQYAKGLVHLGIAVFLIAIMGSESPWYVITAAAIAAGFFYVYQIIDAARSARAVQLGQPAPDPFGFAQTFGTGEKATRSNIPTGAVILIGLGVLFMLHTMDVWYFDFRYLWPTILIGLGVWLFARRWGMVAGQPGTCQCPRCRARCLMGPAVLVTLGILFLIDHIVPFGHTWPALLIIIGLIKVYQGNAPNTGHVDVLQPGQPPAGYAPVPPPAPPVPPPPTEVQNG